MIAESSRQWTHRLTTTEVAGSNNTGHKPEDAADAISLKAGNPGWSSTEIQVALSLSAAYRLTHNTSYDIFPSANTDASTCRWQTLTLVCVSGTFYQRHVLVE